MYSIASMFVVLLLILIALTANWLWSLNRAMKSVPPSILAISPNRWTQQQVINAYHQAEHHPINWAARLPPKLARRYLVTGGSGGVGGELVLQLLKRGQEASSIRSIDLRKPERAELVTGRAAGVDFVVADLASAESTQAAVERAWPAEMQRRPLTVFHVAALIDPSRRGVRAYERVREVNVDGTRHLLEAAKTAGADVFIYCSSSSVGLRPVRWWRGFPSAAPRGMAQFLDEVDQDRPLRGRTEYFGNYGYSKAVAERLVLTANSPSFRTGSIRPAHGIYGNSSSDQVIGPCLRKGTISSWLPHVVQNFVHAGNVCLGHLLFEAALATESEKLAACAGRAFHVTDEGPPPTFDDVYSALATMTRGLPIHVTVLQPAVLLMFSYIVEVFDIASRMPILKRFVSTPRGELALLQPGVFTVSDHTIATDDTARQSVSKGGIGYRPACTTLEGIASQVLSWNRDLEQSGKTVSERSQEPSIAEMVIDSIKNVGTGPAAVGA